MAKYLGCNVLDYYALSVTTYSMFDPSRKIPLVITICESVIQIINTLAMIHFPVTTAINKQAFDALVLKPRFHIS